MEIEFHGLSMGVCGLECYLLHLWLYVHNISLTSLTT